MVQYIQVNDYETAEFDGEWVVLNTDKYTVTKLNEIGGFCWSMMKDAQTVDSLCQAIEQEFGRASDNLSEDIEAFLYELMEYGLIQHAV
ncbi:PqqD family protein [Mesobacillus foraminis]|uniref:Coenzyme PQQ synthesis protein D (PqqD) n=1 Tax=Mesobacillus foraminis TaxID=279826 RepID=A0A4R2B633_9BACI|nr:PqqD family protein [Mesobacillus foraminis]TCN22208.1 coenzyme PQQ synthesis protein D (PqqD) [Mesobacillus foraminis]